jgi:flavin-binding protein dodecin
MYLPAHNDSEDSMARKNDKAKVASSVYKVIELVGTSSTSWADAARNAIESAGKTLRDIRVAEVSKLDVKVNKAGEMIFRAKMKLSFKYHQD